MVTGFEVYLILMLNSVIGVAGCVLWTCMLAICVLAVNILDYGDIDGNLKKWLKRAVVTGLVAILVLAFVPNTKQAAVIYLLPKIANNEQVQKLPDNALKLLNAKMEQYLNGMLEKK